MLHKQDLDTIYYICSLFVFISNSILDIPITLGLLAPTPPIINYIFQSHIHHKSFDLLSAFLLQMSCLASYQCQKRIPLPHIRSLIDDLSVKWSVKKLFVFHPILMKLGEIVEYLRTMKYNTSAPPFVKIRSLDEKQKQWHKNHLLFGLDQVIVFRHIGVS